MNIQTSAVKKTTVTRQSIIFQTLGIEPTMISSLHCDLVHPVTWRAVTELGFAEQHLPPPCEILLLGLAPLHDAMKGRNYRDAYDYGAASCSAGLQGWLCCDTWTHR